jgi:hypothetical protein
MLLHLCCGIGGLVLLSAIFVHLRKNLRISGGIVLAAAMLTLQAIFQPSAEQTIALQLSDDTHEVESEDGDSLSLKSQMRHHAKRIRSGQAQAPLSLRFRSRDCDLR